MNPGLVAGRLIPGRSGLTHDSFVTPYFNRMLAAVKDHLLIYVNEYLSVYLNRRFRMLGPGSIESALRPVAAVGLRSRTELADPVQLVYVAPRFQPTRVVIRPGPRPRPPPSRRTPSRPRDSG